MEQYMLMLYTILRNVLTVHTFPNINTSPHHTDTADMLPLIIMTLLTCLIA